MAYKATASSNLEKNLLSLFSHNKLISLHIIGFLLGRGGILDNLTPFGIGFYAAIAYRSNKYLTIALAIMAGIISTQGAMGSIKYGIALGAIAILYKYFLSLRKIKSLGISLIASGIYILVSLIFLSRVFLYDLLMIAFEGLVIIAVTYISSYSIPIALKPTNRRVLSTEELICGAILMALALSGIKEISIAGISVRNVLGILLTIIFAYNGGGSTGASVGIIFGLISSMSVAAIPPIIIGIYGFSGLLAGAFRPLGKTGSGIGFMLGNAILTFYISGYYEVFIQLKEVMVAFVLFFMIPLHLLNHLQLYTSSSFANITGNRDYGEIIKNSIHEKLIDFSDTFYQLSASFQNMVKQVEGCNNEELAMLVEKVAEGVCKDCTMRRSCWDKNFINTYKGIEDLFLILEVKEEVTSNNIPENIKKRCVRGRSLIEKTATIYELNRINLSWRKKLLEGRELVGQQLNGVANGIHQLALEVYNDIKLDTELEDLLYVALDKEGLRVKSILVTYDKEGNKEIAIEKKACYKKSDCVSNYIPVISKTLGESMTLKTSKCSINYNTKSCCFKLVEANRFTVLTKVAQATKGGNFLSGDTYSFLELKDSQYMMALSDGMGSGEKAHLQSSATISMLEKMMEAGFNQEMAIKTINSILMLKASDEVFSTIDMAFLDLHKGKASFIKIGSAPTYIKKRRGEVEMISSSSLPIGILSEIQIQETHHQLQDGDFIIMISDGILENHPLGDGWLHTFLHETDGHNPQQLADKILHEALKGSNNKPNDDMTVLVTKVWTKQNLNPH